MEGSFPDTTRSPLKARSTLLLVGGVLGITLGGFGLALVTLLLFPAIRTHALTILAWMILAIALASVSFIGLMLRRRGLGWSGIGLRRPTRKMLHLLWQIPAMFVALIAVQITVFLVFGIEPASDQSGLDSLFGEVSSFTVLMLLFNIALLWPLLEEVVFRGLIYGGFRRRFGLPLSVLISATLFSGAHAVPILIPYYLALGISLALLYELHKTLWASFVAHAFLNGLVCTLLLLGLRG